MQDEQNYATLKLVPPHRLSLEVRYVGGSSVDDSRPHLERWRLGVPPRNEYFQTVQPYDSCRVCPSRDCYAICRSQVRGGSYLAYIVSKEERNNHCIKHDKQTYHTCLCFLAQLFIIKSGVQGVELAIVKLCVLAFEKSRLWQNASIEIPKPGKHMLSSRGTRGNLWDAPGCGCT